MLGSVAKRWAKPGGIGAALTAGQLALLVHQHWRAIPAERRERLRELVVESKGRPSNLSSEERRELRELVRGLDLRRLLRRRSARVAALGRGTR